MGGSTHAQQDGARVAAGIGDGERAAARDAVPPAGMDQGAVSALAPSLRQDGGSRERHAVRAEGGRRATDRAGAERRRGERHADAQRLVVLLAAERAQPFDEVGRTRGGADLPAAGAPAARPQGGVDLGAHLVELAPVEAEALRDRPGRVVAASEPEDERGRTMRSCPGRKGT